MTSIIQVDPLHPEPERIARAASVLRAGGLVAFPTETVYGLGANALDADAVRRIYQAKGRPGYNPLIAHVADEEGARRLASRWPPLAARLAEAFWPGPLTLVVPRRPEVPDVVTAGLDTVAVRAPSHPVARALITAAGVPVAAPSANRFTELSPTLARHVERSLGGRVDLIVDGGPTTVGIESTVVDVSGDAPLLLRPGGISAEELEPLTGPLAAMGPIAGSEARPSPGMIERHYAPRAELRLFDSDRRGAAADAARVESERGRKVGALLLAPLAAPIRHPILMPTDPAAYARALYASLHLLDEEGCDVVLVERVPGTRRWEGVADRLERGAVRVVGHGG
ncbi:MAG TPA: L-threonylcarbamoyladenylate synthase [Gemmatimonadaceae bacterium]|nr:L-threonylcarbamoyladenylate synthase [Gemmatimonadaceae bacterium]